jgi:nucleotide-binding universal stress UspA family protein
MHSTDVTSSGLRFRTVLVPHDFTPESDAALRYAAELADAEEGVIHLLHVVPVSATTGPLESALPHQTFRRVRGEQRAVEARLAEASARLRVPVENHVAVGAPAPVICHFAEKLQADLIVMAARSHRGVASLMHGSITARTVRRAPCPVFTVRRRVPH